MQDFLATSCGGGGRRQAFVQLCALLDSELAVQASTMVSRWPQVNALLRKSWAFQRKSIISNLAIIFAPVFVAAVLGSLQALLNRLISEQSQVPVLTSGS